jgi:glycosyltransferase involved in cell wall biosynthesis/tetratricopeptide (TPR) repeat protein
MMPRSGAIPSNDYSGLEADYLAATGHELVSDPLDSMRHHPPLTLSVSLVIPAWKAGSTLERCLTAIALSSFNRRYPDRLEVVVVADGSTDGTWDLLQRFDPGLALKAVRKDHGRSKAQTQNTGFAFAEGDVVISLDADILLAPFTIEEFVKRHEYAGRALLLGCYSPIAADDPRVAAGALSAGAPLCPPLMAGDPRFAIGSSWPESVFRDTYHLKRLGGERRLVGTDGRMWPAWLAVYGALISMLRSDWRAIGGYDERFIGWGSEDAMVGVRAEEIGIPIIPVYSALGWHIEHPPRGDLKREDADRNWRLLNRIRRVPLAPRAGETIDRAARRVTARFDHRRSDGAPPTVPVEAAIGVYDERLADPMARGDYLHALGRYDEAVAAYASVPGTDHRAGAALVLRARSLRLSGRAGTAVALLQGASTAIAGDAGALGELALSWAAGGSMMEGRHWIERARRLTPTDPTVSYIVDHEAAHHRWRAGFYAQQGDHDLTVRDCEAALIVDPHDALAWASRTRSRLESGRGRGQRDVRPLPLSSRIVAAGQSIPGWLFPDEAESLIALTLAVAGRGERDGPPLLIDIGSEFGRATVTMGLALRALGRDDARIVAVDAPDVDPDPNGPLPRDVLRAQLAAHGLTEMVFLAPEDDPAPWTRRSHLVLVDGKRDEASVRGDVERYAPNLASGGYLVFHDYISNFPGVQVVVDELLADCTYRLVSHVQSLITLTSASSPTVATLSDRWADVTVAAVAASGPAESARLPPRVTPERGGDDDARGAEQ